MLKQKSHINHKLDPSFKTPLSLKVALSVIGLYFFFNILYIAQGIIIPVAVATIMAVLLHRVVNFFVKRKMKRLLAIIITLLMAFIVVAVLGTLMVSQAIRLSESLPKLMGRLQDLLDRTAAWSTGHFNISKEEINIWFTNAKNNILKSLVLKNTLLSMGSIVVIFVLAPAYVFMILLYQPLLMDFVYKVFGEKNNGQVSGILAETNSVIQSYLTGLLIEMVIVATLNSVGLLILGIPYAILLGILGGLLNLIPYLGNIASAIIYMVIALVTKESAFYALYVLLFHTIVQLLDNNIVVPKIVGGSVKLNALASFIAVIAGGVLWGIAGMFLAIPLIGIVKVVCDHTETLKPVGRLLGNTMPPFLESER